MRLRAVCLLAFAVLLCDAARTRFAADPPHTLMSATGSISPIPTNDVTCPGATHVIKACPDLPATVFLVFDTAKGRANNPPSYAMVRGEADMAACPPYTLFHVRRVARTEFIPSSCPPPPCFPPTCTPG